MDWGNALITVIVALIAATPGIVAYFRSARKDRADATDQMVNTSMKVMESLDKKVSSLERDIRNLKRREKLFMQNQRELMRVIQELKDILKENCIDYDIEPELVDVDLDIDV